MEILVHDVVDGRLVVSSLHQMLGSAWGFVLEELAAVSLLLAESVRLFSLPVPSGGFACASLFPLSLCGSVLCVGLCASLSIYHYMSPLNPKP